jgi:myo-inositol catabolism protein IolC
MLEGLALEHPDLDSIYENIVDWIGKNFVKAVLQYQPDKKNFKFTKVKRITKVWKESDHWVVDALIEYELSGVQTKAILFQVNGEGRIVGFDLRIEPLSTAI